MLKAEAVEKIKERRITAAAESFKGLIFASPY